jgi:hypothetical protein
MSTSHYSRRPEINNMTSPSRTDDYPEIPPVSPPLPPLPPNTKSHTHSRPACCDVGSGTMRLPLPLLPLTYNEIWAGAVVLGIFALLLGSLVTLVVYMLLQ